MKIKEYFSLFEDPDYNEDGFIEYVTHDIGTLVFNNMVKYLININDRQL